jgi:predicted TIM-barrel fold metal-dependent hydrolase
MIFDAHMHLPCYDGLVALHDKKKRLLHDIKAAGVVGGIVIADSERESPIGTTEECVELFSDNSNIYVVGGISPLIDYETRLAASENLLKQGKIIGIKLYPGHETYFMDDVRLLSVFNLCEKYNVPLLIHTGWDNPQYNHPKFFAQVAEKHPSLKLVVCHLWYPNIDLCFEVTANYSNIYYDISSLAHDEHAFVETSSSLNKIVRKCPDRVVMGSDYGMCSILAHIDLVDSLQIDLDVKKAILCNNAINLYNICAYYDDE